MFAADRRRRQEAGCLQLTDVGVRRQALVCLHVRKVRRRMKRDAGFVRGMWDAVHNDLNRMYGVARL